MKTIQIQINAGYEYCGECELCREGWRSCQKFGDLEQIEIDRGVYTDYELKRHSQCLAAEQPCNKIKEPKP